MIRKLAELCPNHFDAEKYEFCWIVDVPMYEIGEESGELEFCHKEKGFVVLNSKIEKRDLSESRTYQLLS